MHRDIKPANIVVSDDFETATLLDLGIVRPMEPSDLTDPTSSKHFIGTARYSPPEFLTRTENSWTAVTFYQLGAVLHDLIMRKRCFAGRDTPPGRLVQAVLHEELPIESPDVPQGIINLAKACLVKNPEKRLSLVSWDMFDSPEKRPPRREATRERIHRMRSAVAKERCSTDAEMMASVSAKLDELAQNMRQACVRDTDTFPPVALFPPRSMEGNPGLVSLAVFAASPGHQLSSRLHVFLQMAVLDETSGFVSISVAAGLAAEEIQTWAEPLQAVAISCAPLASIDPEAVAAAAYLAMEAAMEREALGYAIPTAGFEWLSIGGMNNE